MKKQSALLRVISLIALVSFGFVLTGCATPSNKAAMSISKVEQAASNPEYLGAFKLGNILGGKETNPLWTSQVSNGSFKAALEDSLRNVRYLASGSEGVFVIDANLQKLDQPLFGLTFDVTSEVSYRIEGRGYTKTLQIVSVGTATVSDAFIGIERLRIANERSIKQNITDFINTVDRDKDMLRARSTISRPGLPSGRAIPSKCLELGFKEGTRGYQSCIEKLAN